MNVDRTGLPHAACINCTNARSVSEYIAALDSASPGGGARASVEVDVEVSLGKGKNHSLSVGFFVDCNTMLLSCNMVAPVLVNRASQPAAQRSLIDNNDILRTLSSNTWAVSGVGTAANGSNPDPMERMISPFGKLTGRDLVLLMIMLFASHCLSNVSVVPVSAHAEFVLFVNMGAEEEID